MGEKKQSRLLSSEQQQLYIPVPSDVAPPPTNQPTNQSTAKPSNFCFGVSNLGPCRFFFGLFVFFIERGKKQEKKSQKRLCLIPHPSPCSCTRREETFTNLNEQIFSGICAFIYCVFLYKDAYLGKNNENTTEKKSPPFLLL